MTSTFQKLRFRIYDVAPDKDLLEEFPELTRYDALVNSKAANKNLLLRYLIFMYDPDTDLIKDITALEKRKVRAAELAGFGKDTDVSTIFDLSNADARELMMCLVTDVYHDLDYAEWVTLCEEQDRIRLMRIDPARKLKSDDKELDRRAKLRKHSDEIQVKIDERRVRIWGDNKDVENIFLQSRYLSPEHFAGLAQVQDE